MLYKLGTVADLTALKESIDPTVESFLREQLEILEQQYGSNRLVDSDDGGYLIYLSPEESGLPKEYSFLFVDSEPEFQEEIHSTVPYLAFLFLLNNEFSITLVGPKSLLNK